MTKKSKFPRILLAVFLIGAAVGGYLWIYRVAPTPPIFDESVTLSQASDRAAAEGEIVLAVVTADFCPTCQAYKREALSDDRVAQWAATNAQTVYLEWERDAATIEELGIEKWPATLVLDSSGDVIAMRYGKLNADDLIAFANDAIRDQPSPSIIDGDPGQPDSENDGSGG